VGVQQAEGLRKRYGDRPALDGFDLTVEGVRSPV
jgi:ABC-type multidrug transport system ATPase subunit